MKKKIKLQEKIKKICKLCGIDFDIWAETMHFNQEREERMKKYALGQCRTCKCSPECST